MPFCLLSIQGRPRHRALAEKLLDYMGSLSSWDNAPTESFWGRLKTASLHGKKLAIRQQVMDAVMDWMAFYNHRRLHSTLGYRRPMQYEERWHAAQRKKAA
jgi:transposase InsO family protein